MVVLVLVLVLGIDVKSCGVVDALFVDTVVVTVLIGDVVTPMKVEVPVEVLVVVSVVVSEACRLEVTTVDIVVDAVEVSELVMVVDDCGHCHPYGDAVMAVIIAFKASTASSHWFSSLMNPSTVHVTAGIAVLDGCHWPRFTTSWLVASWHVRPDENRSPEVTTRTSSQVTSSLCATTDVHALIKPSSSDFCLSHPAGSATTYSCPKYE